MGKGGGGSSKSYDYFGTLAAVVCRGPVDGLQAIIVDGKTILTGPRSITADATTWTSLDAGQEKYLAKGGRITLYRGTQTSPDAALSGHPDYRGTCYIVFEKLLFGRERTSAPNVQVLVSRKPVADTSLVSATHNVLTALDGSSRPTDQSQANPVAVLVEILTSAHGLGLPVTLLDASAWLAAGEWAADASRILYTFCSPLLTSQSEVRQVLTDLLTMIDAALYWTAEGKLSITLLKPGVTPSGVRTFDARHLVERARIDAAGWVDVPTSVAIRYPDRTASYKQRQAKIEHAVALRQRSGVPQVVVQDRPHITGADQASAHAVEFLRRASQPLANIEIRVRRPLAADLHPGAKVQVDVDPEPGGAGLAQLCIVQEVRAGSTGPVQLRLRPDTLATSTPYSPAWSAASPEAPDCPPIDTAKAVVVPLRPGVNEPASVAVLMPRPRPDVVGVRVWFGTDTGGDFADLGSQSGFAVRASLGADIDDAAEGLILALPEGVDGPDAYLAERYPGTEIGAQADDLLLVLAELDVDGLVEVDGDGLPVLEICSIITRAAVGSDIVYTVLRGRLGTTARSWTSSAARGWIIPEVSLTAWTHPDLAARLWDGGTGLLRLIAYTAEAEDDTIPIPEMEFGLPPGYDLAPRVAWTTPGGSGATVSGDSYTVAFTIADRDGDLAHITLHAEHGGDTDVLADYPLLPTGSAVYSHSHTFAPGTHTLVVTCADIAGNVTQSSRVLTRTSGGALVPPTFSPPGGDTYTVPMAVTIACASPCDRLEWALLASGAPAPASGTPHAGTSKVVTVIVGKRLWARAGTSSAWSAWVLADYQSRNAGGGGSGGGGRRQQLN